ncbi:MAG TPA: hypothetical protein DG754_08940 [Bacteroidales bacterium]|nr:hypothetical protein [Bacteroidales bacterium]
MNKINFLIIICMLGVIAISRHFLPKKIILKIIDSLFCYKINKLHLNLTNGQDCQVKIATKPIKLKDI